MKVYGIAATFKLDFKQNEKGLWEAIIPFLPEKEVIVQIYAIDDAGNMSYKTNYILMYDITAMKCLFKPCPFEAENINIRHTEFLGCQYRGESIV